MSSQSTQPPFPSLEDAFFQAFLAKMESDVRFAHAVAERLAPYLPQAVAEPNTTGWLDFEGALQYLGMKKGTLYKLTSARTIPFHQDGPGCKLWFLRSDLDQWRQNSGARRTQSTQLRAA